MTPMLDATAIAHALHRDGWWVGAAALDAALCEALAADLKALDAAAQLSAAGVGRAASYRRDPTVRGDRIAWLAPATAAQRAFLAELDSLRIALNRSLYLGLVEAEAHFAQYDPGARYRRHVDSFVGGTERVVSLVAYLNADWDAADGGELVLYAPDGARETARVVPRAGTVVVFSSAEVPHEVLTARRARASIAAWLRRAPDHTGRSPTA
jgi:SM-20-related protein